MKRRVSQVIAGILAVIMTITAVPLPAKAEESYTETYAYELEAMKEQILGSEEAEGYGSGAVTFPGTATAVNVGNELVYHLFRQGNTDEEQTVTLVTQDLTAGYGDDYELKVDGEILDGKANILLNGEGVTYDVYLGESGTSGSSDGTDGSTEDEASEEDSEQAVDMEQVKEDASCTFDLTFAPGEQVKEIRVRAKMPEKAVGNKEFQLIVFECKDGLENGENITSVVTLMETRETEAAVVGLVEDSEEVVDGYVTVLVERTGNTNGYTSYELTSESGTAVNGEDYILSSTQLLFTPGVSLQRVHIPLVSAESEEEKTFTLRTGESEEEITYTTTTVGATTSFKTTRGLIDISMHDFVVGESTEAVDSVVFDWEEDSVRYKFGFRSVVGGGNNRNASIRTNSQYDFTGIEAVQFSGSYGVGTVAGDHLDVYVSNEDYALNEGMLGNLSTIGARYSVTNLTGQGMHKFSVARQGEYYLYMTAEQHSGSGWIYYYLYNQDFDGGNEGHVALVKKAYTLQTASPRALGTGTPAGNVKLTLSTDASVTGDKISPAYRDESFQISYTLMDEEAKFAGYELLDSQYNVYYREYTQSPVFKLTSDIIGKYSDKFTDDTIIIRPIFEYEDAKVKILKQNFETIGATTLSAEVDEVNGKAVYKDGAIEIATVTWNPVYTVHSDLTFTVTENEAYTGEYHFTAFKVSSGSGENSPLTNPIYHSTSNNEWSLKLEDGYYEITPIISNRTAKLLLNVTGATHGTFDYEPEGSTADEYTVEEYDGNYDANDIVVFEAKPDDGYRAKWSYHDVASGETKNYYGSIFYYRVQVPMLITDNHVSLEFETCDTKKEYSVVADVSMQGGNLLHEPAADSDVYSALAGALVSLEGVAKESADDGSAGIFTLNALPGEKYTALVTANNRQYIQEVVIPTEDVSSVRQKMKLSYYYEGPRVTSLQYYAYDGTVQNGDAIYLTGDTDSVIIAAEIEKAGQEVTDVIYKLKNSDGALKGSEVIAERNGSEYIWSAPLGMTAAEGDQIWIELVKREYNADGKMVSQISYGEVNTGYTIVIAEFTETSYIPDTGVDQDVDSVPIFGSMYFMLGKWGMKLPTFSVSKSGGITYLTIGVTFGGMKNFLHPEGESGVAPLNTWTSYKKNFEKTLEAMTDRIINNDKNTAIQKLKKSNLAMNVAISAQLALYDIVNEETKNSELVCVGSWMTFGLNGAFTYNMPFFISGFPMYFCVTLSGAFSDTVQLTAKDSSGYVALQAMHDPTKSSYKSENDLKFDASAALSLGAGVNGLAGVAGGGTCKFAFDWVDLSWGTIKFTASVDVKVDLLIFGGNASYTCANETLVNTNPYTQATVAAEASAGAEEQIINQQLSGFTMRSIDSYSQTVNTTSQTGLRTVSASSEALISDAYEFSRPKMYSMGKNEQGQDMYMILATVDSQYVGGLETTNTEECRAVLAYAIYNAATGTYKADEQGKIFQSLEPAEEGAGRSINFHPSVTAVGNTGKYLITWNSILSESNGADLNLATVRPVIKAAVYDGSSDEVVAYKSLVTADDEDKLMCNTVLDTAFDSNTNEVVILYRALNLNGIDESSKLIDYATAGSTLMCTSIKLDSNEEAITEEQDGGSVTTFTDSVLIETGGCNDGLYNVIKTADLAIMNGKPFITYQVTKGEQANLISTAEEGSTNHIYLASLTHDETGYKLGAKKEVTEGISDSYNASPQLQSYTLNGIVYDILMWKTENGMATINPVTFMSDDFSMGTVDENSEVKTEPNYTGEGTASIANASAGSMGDFQIIQGQDGKIYSIWTEGTGTGSKVMMAALESISDGCDDEKDEKNVSWGTGNVVFETTDNTYARAISPVVDSNGVLHALYRETLIDNSTSSGYSEIVLKKADLQEDQLIVENYSGKSDEEIAAKYSNLANLELYVSNLYPVAGETLTIQGRVKNAGVQASAEQELVLCVNGASTEERITIPAMNAGIEDEFTFTYTVPDDYNGDSIEFSVSDTRGTTLRQSTVSDAVLDVSSVDFEQLTYLGDSDTVSYNVTLYITNTGNDVSEETTFVLSHIENGKENGEDVVIDTELGTCAIPVVKPGEIESVTFQVDIPKTYFEENTFKLASIAGAVYSGYDPADSATKESRNMVASFTDYVQAVEEPAAETVTMAKSKKVGVGQSMNLRVAVSPSTAQEYAGLTYKSSDSSIAAIDENGIITGVKEGTCTITVTTKNGIQKTITILVTKDAVSEDDEVYDSEDTNGDGQKDNADTGDNRVILPFVVLLAVSGVLIIGAVIVKRKRNHK